MKKKIAITMGDAAGIGPEVSLKAVTSEDINAICQPILIGDKKIYEEVSKIIKVKISNIKIIEPYKLKNFIKGKPTKESAIAFFNYIKYALKGCLKGEFHAMVTSPISKEALRMAGFSWTGHTEMLAELTNTKDYAMMLIGGGLRVVLVTTHIPLKDVPKVLTIENIYKKIILAKMSANLFGISSPVIGVAALNPHAGEGGIFGSEEKDFILPAVNMAKQKGINVEGPIPADVIFYLAYNGKIDIIVSMYHDQGLGPLKMIAFEKGVNLTLGLPIIRTSPDHGTAYDIAYKGIANPESMIEAIKIASVIQTKRNH